MAIAALFEKKLRRLSARPAGGDAWPPRERETIVISIASDRLQHAFDEARKQLGTASGDVRAIAHGATLERAWPDWIRSEKRLVVTEPGALTYEPLDVATRDLQDELRAWMKQTFGDRASEELYTSARARFLQTPIVTYPIAKALADAFVDATVISLDAANHTDTGGWDPDLFRRVLERAGCRVELPLAREPRATAWPARIALKGALALGGATALQVRDFARARSSPSGLPALFIALARGSAVSARAITTLMPRQKIESRVAEIDLAPHLWPLLSLATLDVLRGDTRASPSDAPKPAPPPWSHAPRARCAANVLLLNRHGHPDLVGDGVFRDRLFQEEFLDVGRQLAAQHPELSFRWRPDPATVDEAIAHGRSFFPAAELSRRSLEEDAKWADVIVASWSNAVYEALFANVPVVIQARSEMIGLPILAPFADDRLFWTTSEGVARVTAALAAITRGDPTVLAPEQRARALKEKGFHG